MRKCDKCNLCCKYFTIEDHIIKKPNNDLCPHWKENGCQIYNNRGPVCKTYQCLWISEYLPEWMKPDKIEILFDRFWLDHDHIYMIGHVDSTITTAIEKVIKQVCNSGISVMVPQNKTGIFKKILYESTITIIKSDEENMIKYAKHFNLLVDRYMRLVRS